MADTLKQEIGVDPKLIESGGGVFEVMVDGDLIFSKKKEGRFPEDSEILNLLKSKGA
ncbi:MAG: SelT/SelW/SelH family protein [Candidatus Eisenbacteria bacterium]|nr:SelT/SelW/SelH family protein [Candidatus Eisenbacteria bacterium]